MGMSDQLKQMREELQCSINRFHTGTASMSRGSTSVLEGNFLPSFSQRIRAKVDSLIFLRGKNLKEKIF